jgi:hypothetical protein
MSANFPTKTRPKALVTSQQHAGSGTLDETGGCGGVGFESRNGLDQTGDGERVAYATVAADQVKGAALTRKLNGTANQRGDARAVDLGYAIEIHDDLAAAILHNRLEHLGEVLAGFPYGQAAVNYEEMDAA